MEPKQDSPALVREVGDRVTRIISDCLVSRTTQSITDPTPVADLRALFHEPLPRRGTPHAELLDVFTDQVVPHTLVNTSPGYLGLMNPTPVTMSIFADALTSLINQNQAASHHSPAGSVIEEVVIRWLGEATGYGADCYGHLTSGGTVANMTGLKLALHRAAPEVRDRGLVASGRRFTVYASDQLHFSIERSVDVLGLGREALRLVPARDDATVDPEVMRGIIEADRREGMEPFAMVGIAGATASGAVDPLSELADLAVEAGLWFHVDAAYGGAAGLSQDYPGLLAGIERADSVTVDAHKWFFVPFVAGGILFRDRTFAEDTFQNAAGYIPPSEAAELPPTDYLKQGLAGTRRFNALKVWMAFKHLGADWYASVVDRQLGLTRKVAERIADLPEWRIAVPPATAIVTFRYEPEGLREVMAGGGTEAEKALRERDRLQMQIAEVIQQEGRFWVSAAPVPCGFAIRLNVISWLTDEALIDAFLAELPRYAREALGKPT
ncbi:pyridoxal phosphate-dependent decarboxylase family protein [Gemmatimonadota bacterium]